MAIYMWIDVPPDLCFTANTAGSTLKLNRSGTFSAGNFETSTNGTTWSAYTLGTTITLSSVGSCVYFRNTSTITMPLSNGSSYHQFVMTGSISASGDVTSMVNKNCTTDLGNNSYIFLNLFLDCAALTTPPSLSGPTEIPRGGYCQMFQNCTGLEALPKLPATLIGQRAYMSMFWGCSKIKLSTTQTGDYQTPYRLPSEGTGSTGGNIWNGDMFYLTGGTFKGSPSINTTYYTSNEVID